MKSTEGKTEKKKTHQVGNINKDFIGYKEYVKNAEKAEKHVKVQESLKQSIEYQDFLKTVKNDKQEKQKAYKEFLDKQTTGLAERELVNKMTKQEKKINFGDLQAYKDLDGKMFSLIPGFINSKYTTPFGGPELEQRSPGKGTKANDMYQDQLAKFEATQQSYGSPLSPQGGMMQSSSIQNLKTAAANNTSVDAEYQRPQPEYTNLQSLSSSPARERQYEMRQNEIQDQRQYQSQAQYQPQPQPQYQYQDVRQSVQPQVTSPHQNPQFASNTYDRFNPVEQQQMMNSTAPDNYKSTGETGSYAKKSHNPLTNPLPFNVQNPYIAKEMNKVIQKRPYFANMATNNLIG